MDLTKTMYYITDGRGLINAANTPVGKVKKTRLCYMDKKEAEEMLAEMNRYSIHFRFKLVEHKPLIATI